jgi:pimeloyl-ACP methyl ester carboxylesterase
MHVAKAFSMPASGDITPLEQHEGSPMTATRQIDGIDIYIEGAGDETIVMIHGWPDTYRLWDAQVEAFKGRFRCVRFTLPGFDVDKPRQAYSRAQLIDTFKHIVEQTCPAGK